jgi:predicted metal-dependent peptidase
MMTTAENGGNAFLFSLIAGKPHYIVEKIYGRELGTAATNGRSYYWNADFMESLTQDQLRLIQEHEIYHNVFHHTNPARTGDKDPVAWNFAVDFVVNNMIVSSRRHNGAVLNKNETSSEEAAKVFGSGGLGRPITLKEIKKIWSGKQKPDKEKIILVDLTIHDKTAEWIYEELAKAHRQNPQHGKGFGECPLCKGQKGMDDHVPSELSKDETQSEVMKAAAAAKAMGKGKMPAGMEDMLKELTEPKLSAADIIKACLQRRSSNSGSIKNYTRFRRRGFGLQPTQYWPKFFDHKPRWIAMLDTSGSHDPEQMARGISELKLVSHDCDGIVVPCDAEPYWDKATKVHNIDDLKRVNSSGRGGTVFEDFFKGLKTIMPGPWDVVVLVSDGFCDQIPMNLHPHCDVLWLITAPESKYTPSFGRVLYI